MAGTVRSSPAGGKERKCGGGGKGPPLQPAAVRGDEGLAQAEATITAGDIGLGEYLESIRFEAVAQALHEKMVLEGSAA